MNSVGAQTQLILNGMCVYVVVFFFFQAEDGIRDYKVTGVQTCALPIWRGRNGDADLHGAAGGQSSRGHAVRKTPRACGDRKSTRLNSSHLVISYAVFCLKKKKRLSAQRTPPAASPMPLTPPRNLTRSQL